MPITCECPECHSSNVTILIVEIWQKDREFKVEEGKLIELQKDDAYFKDESFDSRLITCLDCKKTSPSNDDSDILIDMLKSSEGND